VPHEAVYATRGNRGSPGQPEENRPDQPESIPRLPRRPKKPVPGEPSQPAFGSEAQARREPVERQESSPPPFDLNIEEFEIVEPPEDEDRMTVSPAFRPGPRKRLNFEPQRVRGPRRGEAARVPNASPPLRRNRRLSRSASRAAG